MGENEEEARLEQVYLDTVRDMGAGDEQTHRVYYAALQAFEKGDSGAILRSFESEDPARREATLNALWGDPRAYARLGDFAVELAVRGAGDPAHGVRTEACYVIQNQSAWGVDVTPALEPLARLLNDPVGRVRQQAAFAVGNVARKRRYDLTDHLPLLRRNLGDSDTWAPGAAAWALAQLSRGGRDISAAVPELVEAISSPHYDPDLSRRAAGALLHHAKKSEENLQQVRSSAAGMHLQTDQKPVQKLVDFLGATGA
jgi:hypothetical protein